MARVSVVVPTYNRADVIPRAIDSVLDQTYGDLEIIVVDDNSDDDTQAVVNQYECEQLNYIKHGVNRGGSAARNTGIKRANGELIAFLDSDDEYKPTKLQRQVARLNAADEETGIIYTGYYVTDSSSTRLGNIPCKNGNIFEDQLFKDWVSPTSTVLARRECFENVGFFDESLPARQDYEMWLRLSKHYHFEYIEEPLVILHTGQDNRITDNYTKRVDAHKEILDRIEEDIQSLGLIDRHRAWSKQYQDLGYYLQYANRVPESRNYLYTSIKMNPFNFESWLLVLLSHFNVRITAKNLDPYVTKYKMIKNKIRGDDRG